MTSRLVIFDVDGTLTDTTGVDNELYLDAMTRALAVPADRCDWTDAPHMTDSGIAIWVWTRIHGREPSQGELDAMRDYFIARLEEHRAQSPARFREIAG